MIHGHFQTFLTTLSWIFYLFQLLLGYHWHSLVHHILHTYLQSIDKHNTISSSSNPLSTMNFLSLINCFYMDTCLMSMEVLPVKHEEDIQPFPSLIKTLLLSKDHILITLDNIFRTPSKRCKNIFQTNLATIHD